MSSHNADDALDQMAATGWSGPFALDAGDRCRVISAAADAARHLTWHKSLHEFDTPANAIATHPAIVDPVRRVLGDDLILWGTQVMNKPPGVPHRWHVDVETLAWTSVNVWVALDNVTLDSTIGLIPGSHRWEEKPQDWENDGIDLTDSGLVHATARSLHPGCSGVEWVDMKDGEFVVFDGHLWHGSENRTKRRRSALLLQYSPTSATARIPATFGDPVTWKDERPPCLLVHGSDTFGKNRLVDPARAPRSSLLHRAVDIVRRRR